MLSLIARYLLLLCEKYRCRWKQIPADRRFCEEAYFEAVRCDLLSSRRNRDSTVLESVRFVVQEWPKTRQAVAGQCRLRMRFPLALFDTIPHQRDVGETLLHASIERTRQRYVRRCGTAARTVVPLCNIQSGRSAISLFRPSFLCAWRILYYADIRLRGKVAGCSHSVHDISINFQRRHTLVFRCITPDYRSRSLRD